MLFAGINICTCPVRGIVVLDYVLVLLDNCSKLIAFVVKIDLKFVFPWFAFTVLRLLGFFILLLLYVVVDMHSFDFPGD